MKNDNDSYGIITPPNNLKKKVKITIVKDGKETEAVENAELAMAAMSDDFKEWLQDEVNKFDTARKAMCEEKNTKKLKHHIYRCT